MLEHIKYTSPGKPVASPVGGAGVDMELGVTCFSFTAQDLTMFVVGVDGGGLLLCSTVAAKPAPGCLSSIDLQREAYNHFMNMKSQDFRKTPIISSQHRMYTYFSSIFHEIKVGILHLL